MRCLTTVAVLLLAGTAYSKPWKPNKGSPGTWSRDATFRCLAYLGMRAGDIVTCPLPGLVVALGSKHYMLATGWNTVIHVVSRKLLSGYIREMKLTEAIGQHECRRCVNWGKYYTERTRQQAVDRARQNRDDKVFYQVLTCNCQTTALHWVNKWTTGSGGISTTAAMVGLPYCGAY